MYDFKILWNVFTKLENYWKYIHGCYLIERIKRNLKYKLTAMSHVEAYYIHGDIYYYYIKD